MDIQIVRWPFGSIPCEERVLRLFPPMTQPYVIGFRLSTCILFINQSILYFDIHSHYRSFVRRRQIDWIYLSPNTSLEDIQKRTGTLVILT